MFAKDITACNRDMFDRTSDNITLSTRNDVRDTISESGVDECSSQRAIGDFLGRPGRGQRSHSLIGDVEGLNVEGFEGEGKVVAMEVELEANDCRS